MKRRLTIARSLINEPDLLLLDEPTTGLDPQARHLLWDRLYRLKQRGVTLVLTTHYMDEAEQLCDRLVVMDKAKIVAEGSPRSLIEQYSTREVTELRFADGVQETLDGQLDGLAERIERLPDRVLLYADDGEAAVAAAHARGLQPETGARPPIDAGGRVPAADRPLAGRLMSAIADATSRHRARLRAPVHHLPAHVPGQHLQLVPDPRAVPGRDGTRARRVRRPRRRRTPPSEACPYIAFLAPGLLVASCMQAASFEATFPIMAGLVWSRVFHAMYATPISAPGRGAGQHPVVRRPPAAHLVGLHDRHRRCSARRYRRWSCSPSRSPC